MDVSQGRFKHNVGHTSQGDGQGWQGIDCSRCENKRSEESLENHIVWGTRCRRSMSASAFIVHDWLQGSPRTLLKIKLAVPCARIEC